MVQGVPEKNIIATLTQNLASECDARRKISYTLLSKAAENLTISECEEFSSQHLFNVISCLDSETTNDCYKDCSGMIVEVAGIEITSTVRLVELLISKESDSINSRLSEAHYGAKLLYVFRSFYHHGLLCQKIKNILCKVITEGRETLVKSLIDDKCIPNDVISLCKSQEYLVNGKVAYKPTRIFLFRIIQRINSSQSSLIRSAIGRNSDWAGVVGCFCSGISGSVYESIALNTTEILANIKKLKSGFPMRDK